MTTATQSLPPDPKATSELSPTHVTIIQAPKGWIGLGLKELWDYREILYFLYWRELKIRYKQTALGAAWAVLQPIISIIIFSVFFGRMARVASDNVAYPVFLFAGLLSWQFFSNGLAKASMSLVGNTNLIQKVYFPRLAVPISAVMSGIPDFLLTFIVFFITLFLFGVTPNYAAMIWLPVFALLAVVACLGFSFWLAAINVTYRDIRYVVPFLIQIWFFSTPIVYSSSTLEEPWHTLYGINPMVSVVEGFRWILVGSVAPSTAMVIVSCVTTVIVFVSGAYYFRRTEHTFADVA